MIINFSARSGTCIEKDEKGKAAGLDNVPIELITALKDVGIMEVKKLLNIIYDTGEIPNDTTKSIFIAIPKMPGAIDCEKYRTNSLVSHLAKVHLQVLMCRMRSKLRPEIQPHGPPLYHNRNKRHKIIGTIRNVNEASLLASGDVSYMIIAYAKSFVSQVQASKLLHVQ